MEIAIKVIQTIMSILGCTTLVGFIWYKIEVRKSQPVNTLYLKRYPDGTKAYRLGLKVNLELLEPGDTFEVIVKEEQPTETDILIYKNTKED